MTNSERGEVTMLFSTLVATAHTYIVTHPEQVAYIVLTILTALTAVFKPKTPEQYAAMNPYAAAAWKVAATLLPDVVKFSKVLPQLLKGSSDPSKEPAKSEESAQ
jgi:CBS domain containing-hemolysin-like protein